MVQIKRVYEKRSPRDGMRILVDRVWPRGITKERAHIDAWRKDWAPSTALRKWFGHDPEKWMDFRARYRTELARSMNALSKLAQEAKDKQITLIYSASDQAHNQAVVLKELLDELQRTKS
jgi:uncharacterized protein YeaO (DUF488 family)